MTKKLIIGLVCLLAAWGVLAQDEALSDDCDAPFDIRVGDIVTIRDGVFVRGEPSLSALQVIYASERYAARVLGGPVCADGLVWWNVERRFELPTFTGWVAQGENGRTYLFAPTREDEDCFSPLDVMPGQAVQMFEGARVREEPSLNGRVVTVVSSGDTAIVNDVEIACVDGYNWWNVTVNIVGVTYTGWIVEGFPGEYTIDPQFEGTAVPCGPATRLAPGDTGILRFEGGVLKNLRTNPDTRSRVVATLPSGLQVVILSDPVCAQGQNWRQVTVTGGSRDVTGWLAEGDWLGRFSTADGDFFLQPIR